MQIEVHNITLIISFDLPVQVEILRKSWIDVTKIHHRVSETNRLERSKETVLIVVSTDFLSVTADFLRMIL